MTASFVDLQGAKGELSFHYTRNPTPRLEMSAYDGAKPAGTEYTSVVFNDVQLARLKAVGFVIHSSIEGQTREVTFTPSLDGTINMNVKEPRPPSCEVTESNIVMDPLSVYCFTGKIIKASLEHRTRQEMAPTVNNSPAR